MKEKTDWSERQIVARGEVCRFCERGRKKADEQTPRFPAILTNMWNAAFRHTEEWLDWSKRDTRVAGYQTFNSPTIEKYFWNRTAARHSIPPARTSELLTPFHRNKPILHREKVNFWNSANFLLEKLYIRDEIFPNYKIDRIIYFCRIIDSFPS